MTSAVVIAMLTLHWHSFVSNWEGIPHVASEDGFCNEYHIPKGSIIIPNIWYADMMFNELKYC